jgi:hypothetical protein
MKKKMIFFCFFAVAMLMALPIVSSNSVFTEKHTIQNIDVEKQGSITDEKPVILLLTGYLLIHVDTWSPGVGIHSYPGANITVKGFLYSYNGTTDETGDCLFKIHTNLFRTKVYFIKVSIYPQDRVLTKRESILIGPRQIVYKQFLFIVL